MKEVKIMLNGKETIVKLKQITLKDTERIQQKVLEWQQESKLNPKIAEDMKNLIYAKYLLLYSIVEPNELKVVERIEQLPTTTATKLMEATAEINTLTTTIKKK